MTPSWKESFRNAYIVPLKYRGMAACEIYNTIKSVSVRSATKRNKIDNLKCQIKIHKFGYAIPNTNTFVFILMTE